MQAKNATWSVFGRWDSRSIATATIIAALNAALLEVFSSISYGPIQFRVSLIIQAPLVFLFGYPAAVGLVLSGFIMNYFFRLRFS